MVRATHDFSVHLWYGCLLDSRLLLVSELALLHQILDHRLPLALVKWSRAEPRPASEDHRAADLHEGYCLALAGLEPDRCSGGNVQMATVRQ